MGTGKTTLGRALAAMPGSRFTYVDLDDYIEAHFGMPVTEIFRRHGEAAFRAFESEALRRLGCRTDVVVGCGGGTPCHSGNMEWMNSHGLTVQLMAAHDVLLRRLTEGQATRPLLAGLSAQELADFIRAKLHERSSHYGKARINFRSDFLETPQQVEASCNEFMQMLSEWTGGAVDDSPEQEQIENVP